MKKLIVLSGLVLCVVSCAAPAVDDALLPSAIEDAKPASSLQSQPTTARSEDAEMAMSRKARKSGKNTYDQTCGPVAARFAQVPMDMRMVKRLGSANDAKPPKPSMTTPPSPAAFPVLETSVVCRVAVDVSVDGIPLNPVAQCSDESFETSAREAMLTARFTPGPYDGLIMPLEFCRND